MWCKTCWAKWWAKVTNVSVEQIEKRMALEIPTISRERVISLVETIHPVVNENGKLWYIAPADPWRIAFTWSPKLRNEATDLEPITTITTLHSWAFYGFFKPSIAEVMAFLPDNAVEIGIVAFSVDGPETVDDLGKHQDALEAGFHVAETTLYRRKQ